ncbi:MAG TPA: hypothetical protein VMX97_08195 [Hyphomicrobiaceae bacterium]|nr:hypothetical protein [Hyphomicrobiaceae bacterium]
MSSLTATRTPPPDMSPGMPPDVGGVQPRNFTRVLFHVTGSADPGLMPRLAGTVAKLGHTPVRFHMSREAGDGSQVTVDLRLAGISQVDAGRIERALRSVLGVGQVIALYE